MRVRLAGVAVAAVVAVAPVLVLSSGFSVSSTAAPAPAAAARLIGPAPDGRALTFDLVLRLPGARRLARVLAAIEDPRSPRFRHVIGPAAFGARFGEPRAAVDRIVASLRADGVQIVAGYPQRTALTVRAPVAVVERLFSVAIGEYRDRAGHRFTRARGTVRLPRALAGVVAGVSGLDTQPGFIAHDVALHGLDPVAAASAYGITALHQAGYQGQGQTIAVVSFSAYDPSDPAAWARQNRLTGPTPQVVSVDGGTSDTSGALEANLDIDVIRAIAPAARILFYEAPQSSAAYADTISQIVKQGRASIISSSWGRCELFVGSGERRADTQALTAAVSAGVSMFVATGDQGAYDCQSANLADHRLSVDWPAASADAVAVGGTRLDVTSAGTYLGEAAWEDQLSDGGGGGGLAVGDARPAWQTGPGVSGPWSDGHRQLPDVSADADPGTPWSFYALGGTGTEGGTSASAPFWSAATALVRQYAAAHGIARLGYVAPILYALAATPQPYPPFHDVVRGGNRYYQAGPGWDPATGLGSPDVFNLARDVVSYLHAHPAACGSRFCGRGRRGAAVTPR